MHGVDFFAEKQIPTSSSELCTLLSNDEHDYECIRLLIEAPEMRCSDWRLTKWFNSVNTKMVIPDVNTTSAGNNSWDETQNEDRACLVNDMDI